MKHSKQTILPAPGSWDFLEARMLYWSAGPLPSKSLTIVTVMPECELPGTWGWPWGLAFGKQCLAKLSV